MITFSVCRISGSGNVVSADRRLRLWGLAAAYADSGPVTVGHVCAAANSATVTDGAAIAVALTATPRETIYSSDRTASEIEELSLTLGEGPCVDALAGGLVLVPDLGTAQSSARWPLSLRRRRRPVRRRLRVAASGRRDPAWCVDPVPGRAG